MRCLDWRSRLQPSFRKICHDFPQFVSVPDDELKLDLSFVNEIVERHILGHNQLN